MGIAIVAIVLVVAFIAVMVGMNRSARRREREGDWDKEGHGTPDHQDPGVKYRGLEVPGKEPFD